MKTRSAIADLIAVMLSVPAGVQIKSWTDEKGVTHYGKEIP